jgi:hypothetical protein
MVLVLVFKVEEGLSSSDVRASGSKANSDEDVFEGLFRVGNLRMTFVSTCISSTGPRWIARRVNGGARCTQTAESGFKMRRLPRTTRDSFIGEQSKQIQP